MKLVFKANVLVSLLSSIFVSGIAYADVSDVCLSYQQSALDQVVSAAATARRSAGSGVKGSSNSNNIVINENDVAVFITGHVKKYEDNDLVNAKNIEVRFWKTSKPGVYISTQTDDNGDYGVELSNGEWQGEACGSDVGYSPAAWQVSLKDNKLSNLQEVSVPAPTLSASLLSLQQLSYPPVTTNAMALSLKQNEELVVDGSGFGCNGSLVFEFQNSVGKFGDVNLVEYNHTSIIKNEYCSRTDQQIRLPMPSLMDNRVGNHADSSRYARMYYQKGNQRSNAIYVSEFLIRPLDPDIADAGDRINNNDSINNAGHTVQNLGNLGAVGGGVFTGGLRVFGGDDNPRFGGNTLQRTGSFNAFNASRTASSVPTGFNVRALNTGNIATENMNVNVENINLSGAIK